MTEASQEIAGRPRDGAGRDAASPAGESAALIRWLESVSLEDAAVVGEKAASLGEMLGNLKGQAIRIPDGFVITADAFRAFLSANGLEQGIAGELARLQAGDAAMDDTERRIRAAIVDAEVPAALKTAVADAYRELCRRSGMEDADVAVRSSAIAPGPEAAGVAGLHETFLAVHGEEDLLYAVRRCFASLFTGRAIAGHERTGSGGFDLRQFSLAVCVQRMVRSDKGAAGALCTHDADSGFPDMIVIHAAYGLGESVSQGLVTPDEYRVFKPPLAAGRSPIVEKRAGTKESKTVYGDRFGPRVRTVNTPLHERIKFALTDDQILLLARCGHAIEGHYGKPVEVEWAVDGITGDVAVLQARPSGRSPGRKPSGLKLARLQAENPKLILEGLAVGHAIAAGTVCVLRHASEGHKLRQGQILVAESTDPDWVPVMRKAAAVITDHGASSSHAAMVCAELGIPAIVGTGTGTGVLFKDQEITVSCAEGETGKVYRRILPFDEIEIPTGALPETKTRILLNLASPGAAERWWQLPCHGIGLARMEFIINNVIRIHPMALARFDALEDSTVRSKIVQITANYDDPRDYFIDELSMGIAHIAASRYPDPVIVRMSDFKSSEYATLIGGEGFEQAEPNPVLGFRGAARYCSDAYRPGFDLECRAVQRARARLGLSNIVVMIPFCRTVQEADEVLAILASHGLRRGEDGLEVHVMAEVPSNIILAREFAERFDGFSIGSGDLTQLTLGIDPQSARVSGLFDESNPAVMASMRSLIRDAHAAGRTVGICGDAASDPEVAAFLVREGIDSISVPPDRLMDAIRLVTSVERELAGIRT